MNFSKSLGVVFLVAGVAVLLVPFVSAFGGLGADHQGTVVAEETGSTVIPDG